VTTGPHPGLWDSPWPAEDGGPRRQLVPRARGLGLRAGEGLVATTRHVMFANMVVLRAPGEVYLQGSTSPAPDNAAFVERIDPATLEPIVRSPDLDAGGVWWPGGIVAHANGCLYVTHGTFCHQLDRDCRVVAKRRLPRPQPYNSLIVLSDGRLVMKNMVMDGSARSAFTVLEPDGLEPVGPEVEIPEGSIARISADRDGDGDTVYVVGDHTIFRLRYDGGRLQLDDWRVRYVTAPDAEQSYGWDPVIAGGHAWFLDNGANDFSQSFRGGGRASGPIHLVRVSLDDARDWELFTPFGAPARHGSRTRRRSSRRAASRSRTTAATRASRRSASRGPAASSGSGSTASARPTTSCSTRTPARSSSTTFRRTSASMPSSSTWRPASRRAARRSRARCSRSCSRRQGSGATSIRARSRRLPAWPSQETD
jgi:hypothetical protein